MANPNIWAPGTSISAANSVQSQAFIATEGQELFTLTNFTYALGTNSLYVFISGAIQRLVVDFTETSISSFTLSEGVSEGTIIYTIAFTEISVEIPVIDIEYVHTATEKTTPANADEFAISDSESGWGLKKLTWANLKAEASIHTHNGGDITSAVANATNATTSASCSGNAATATLAVVSQYALAANDGSAFAFRNKIINGAMRIAQRGISQVLTTSPAFGSVDRWAFSQAGTAKGAAGCSLNDPCPGFQARAYIGRTSGAVTTGIISALYALETNASVPLANKNVTISFYAKAGANLSGTPVVAIKSGTGTDQSTASMGGWTGVTTPLNTSITGLSTTWQRFQYAAVVPANCTQLGIQFYYTPSGTAGADDYFYFTGVQLEEGDNVAPFEDIPHQYDLALCQRYYFRHAPAASGINLGSGQCDSATSLRAWVNFPYPMRVAPTALEQSGTVTDYAAISAAATFVGSGVPTFVSASVLTGRFTMATSGMTAGRGAEFVTNSANAYLGWSAEL